MTDKEIINADGSRNWLANILHDNVIRLEKENAELKAKNTALEETLQTIEQLKDEDSLRVTQLVTENEQLNEKIKELEKQNYETLKMLKHEYNSRQRDNKQWFTRCTKNHNEDSKFINKYKQTLEETKEILKYYADSLVDNSLYPNLHYNSSKAKEGLQKINEILKYKRLAR